MQEFTSVSASSYDPAALASKLTEKSADGWSVVSIVPTGGDVTAFLARESSGATSASASSAAQPAAESYAATTVAAVATPEPAAAAATTEPAGWAMSPEPAAATPTAAAMAPISETTASYQPQSQPASTYQPQAQPAASAPASYQPAAATPSVPAGWYADPAGRFELRYWDGGTWTEHVSRAGQQFTDPPVA